MARVWPVYEGAEPTRGGPWADMPLSEAIALLDLEPGHFLSELRDAPRFGDASRDRWFAGYKHVVVEVGENERRRSNWKPGFYLSPLTPKAAFGRLIERVMVLALGRDKVTRVEWEPSVDSEGRDAVRVTVVIEPDAVRTIKGGSLLKALRKLHEQLGRMGDERTPIVEYATEAELAAVDGH